MRYLLFFGLLLMISACQKKEISVPEGLISKDTMVFVMMDIHLAEAGVKTLAADSLASNTKMYYQHIYKKYHISDSLFRKSLKFYTDNPALLEEIYLKVSTEMSKKEVEVYRK